MVWRYAYCFLRILKLFFLHFNLDIFSSLYATDMYREYMPCIGNPAYSFRPILLKLYKNFAAFLWFHMRYLSLAGYNCSGGASCMAWSFICVLFRRHENLIVNTAPSSIPTSGTFFRGDLVMKTFLRPFSPFRWFKKSSCQLLAKECALSTGKLPRRLAQEQCG